jgi:hypothetical protein
MVVGLVAGLGVGLVLQQFAVLDPGNLAGLGFPIGGLLLGIILPGLAYRRRMPAP